jgi:hypothetical protein
MCHAFKSYITMEHLRSIFKGPPAMCTAQAVLKIGAEAAVLIESELRIASSNTAPKLKQKHNSLVRRAAQAATSYTGIIAYMKALNSVRISHIDSWMHKEILILFVIHNTCPCNIVRPDGKLHIVPSSEEAHQH